MAETKQLKSVEEIDAISYGGTPVGAADAFLSQLPDTVRGSEYTGNIPLVEKDQLERVPFIVQDWTELEGRGETGYVNVHVMLPNGEIVCFNDGGSAIGRTLGEHLEATNRRDGLYCPRGLIRNDYVSEKTGQPATTYWLS